MSKIFITFLLLFLSIFGKQLVMIQETFRHGARYPIFPAQVDSSIIASKTNNVGELTSEGKSMHYLLGKIVYEKYWDLLFKGTASENQYHQADFYVKSTDTNRTLQSAQCHLFGLLQKLPKLQLNKSNYEYSLPAWPDLQKTQNISEMWSIFHSGETFHPTPIHSEKRGATVCDNGDFLTKYDEESCPNQIYWKAENYNSDGNLEIMRDHRIKQTVEQLSKQVGIEIEFDEVYRWTDSFTSMKYLGFPTLKIFSNPQYANILNFIEVYTMYLMLYSQPQQIRVVSTAYFNQTLYNIESKVNKTFTPKIILYSSHDTTIGMIFAAMNFVNLKCLKDHYLNGVDNGETCIWQYPRFSSNIIFQLWNNNGEYSIRFLYNGEVRKIPICGYKTQCTLTEFKAWYQDFKVHDLTTACGFVAKNKTYYAVIFLLASVITCLVFYICYLHAKIKEIDSIGRAKKQGYIQNFQQKAVQMLQNKQ